MSRFANPRKWLIGNVMDLLLRSVPKEHVARNPCDEKPKSEQRDDDSNDRSSSQKHGPTMTPTERDE
jgi:hypothetical protein